MLIGGVVTPAYAYLDPGTGTMLLQGLIAAISGALAFGYYYFDRLKQFLRSFRRGSPATDRFKISQHEADEKNKTQ